MSSAHLPVAIIGSGPAGLTAAIYAARANLAPVVFAGRQYGGQLMLTTDVENYPGFPNGIMGPELMEAFRAQAERFGAAIHFLDVARVDLSAQPLRLWTDDGAEHAADTVIVATGASARWLEIPGEDRLRGHGVSSCATCDGAFFRERRIVVVGGGDSAMEEALFLTRFGKVTIVHRRSTFRASKIMADRVLNHAGIAVIWNTEVVEVLGGEKTEALLLRNIASGTTTTLAADAMFVAIGHDPNTAIFRDQLELDRAGYVVSPDGVTTKIPGVFVAGDVFDIRYKQAVTAAGAGCRAALEVEKYLEALESNATSALA